VLGTLASVLTGLVALLHLYFLVLEMFLWTKPLGLKVFRNTPEKAEASRVLAANQGLYNGFLAAGLAWGLWLGAVGRDIQLFFLGCVVVAGIYGAWSVSRRILWVQAAPAALAMGLVLAA
jgi:putative membrane protein